MVCYGADVNSLVSSQKDYVFIGVGLPVGLPVCLTVSKITENVMDKF